MLAHMADIFSPGDAQGVRTTTGQHHVPETVSYRVDPPNIILGAAGLLVLLWLSHHLTRGRRR